MVQNVTMKRQRSSRWGREMSRLVPKAGLLRYLFAAAFGRVIVIAWGSDHDRTGLWEAVVRRQIENLVADYAHAIDDDRLEEWPEFFCARALLNYLIEIIMKKGNADRRHGLV